MKLISKVTLGLATATLLFVGCGGDSSAKASGASSQATAKATITEESLGLRKTDIYSEAGTSAAKTEYRCEGAGSSRKIERAFQDAPPMIPHDVSGFLPIKIENNACVGCHAPDIAAAMGATPIPTSHFLDMRPKHKLVGEDFTKTVDNYKNETSVKKIDHLSSARFNCSQCHAPQSQGNLAVENTFQANFTRADGATKSSWDEVVMDSLDTVQGGDNFITADDIANKNSAAGSLKAAEAAAGAGKH
jgi:nitrate reductase (cytochrome), electron transfer subunit